MKYTAVLIMSLLVFACSSKNIVLDVGHGMSDPNLNGEIKEILESKADAQEKANVISDIITKYKKKGYKEGQKLSDIHMKEQVDRVQDTLQMQPTPLKTSDVVLRVLIMPWVDEGGTLHSQSYHFVKVDNGKWVIGDYLMQKGISVKSYHPLNADELPLGKQ